MRQIAGKRASKASPVTYLGLPSPTSSPVADARYILFLSYLCIHFIFFSRGVSGRFQVRSRAHFMMGHVRPSLVGRVRRSVGNGDNQLARFSTFSAFNRSSAICPGLQRTGSPI